MATQEYWSAVEEKGLRRNEVACAWFMALAAVVALHIITSLVATPFCQEGYIAAVAETRIQPPSLARGDARISAAADQQPCRRR